MEGTRKSLLDQIGAWVTNKPRQSDVLQSNTYWIYGSPGIGKTALAHSICASLHAQGQLAGAFFCRKDDLNLSEARNILPTLIYKLARRIPHLRSSVAERLQNDPNMTLESMKTSHYCDFICSLPLPRHPNHPLVFVIDGLDECLDTQSRQNVLKVLTDAATLPTWLKIIITSRPEMDIQGSLGTTESSDLSKDQEAESDLRTFARSQFTAVAKKSGISTTWPEELFFNRVISQTNGLFIFIKTLVLALEQSRNPEESLTNFLQGSTGTGSESLYGLYSSILKSHSRVAGFWQMIAMITTAQHRSLHEESIADLAGVGPNLVKKWVDDLSFLLYRDTGASGGIRVRHMSISEFFVSNGCDYKVELQAAHTHLSIACLETMVEQLRFNICKLEDSRLPNADIKDLAQRIEENISDSLQYSSLYWSNHLSFAADKGDQRVMGSLKKFFEGLCPLFWIEVLSIMGMVPIGAPSLRRVITWVKVCTTPDCH